MNKQITLSAFNDELAQVRTKKKEFLAQMDRIILWGEWKALIQPYYYKGERGNKPYELELISTVMPLMRPAMYPASLLQKWKYPDHSRHEKGISR